MWRIAWAHPEFGQVLATGSFDTTAVIWEETDGVAAGGDGSQSIWVRALNGGFSGVRACGSIRFPLSIGSDCFYAVVAVLFFFFFLFLP